MLENIERYIKEKTLIICPDDYKLAVLEYLYEKRLVRDISFLTLAEYKKHYFFDYDIPAVLFLMQNYQLSVNNAKEILDNLSYIDNKVSYGIEKLDKLVAYKRALDAEGLLIYDPLFKTYLAQKNVVVMGYGKLNAYEQTLIEGKTVEIVEYVNSDKQYIINTFGDIEEEVEYLYNAIADLLKKQVDINNIYLLPASGEYTSYFKRFNQYYGFEIAYDEEDTLLALPLSGEFVRMLDSNNRQEIYDFLESFHHEAVEQLMNILNKYAAYDLSEVKELIVADLKTLRLGKCRKSDVVRVVDFFHEFKADDQVFLIGFNDTVPSMKADDEYLTDNVRCYVHRPLVEEENQLIKENMRAYLATIAHLSLSYSRQYPFGKHDVQNLVAATYLTKENDYRHSQALNRVKYAYMLDRLRKYGTMSGQIEDMYKTYGQNDYLLYDNNFGGLKAGQFGENAQVVLSYSSMNDYYECAFRYYLNNIIKLNAGDTYNTKIGKLVHGVLRDLYNVKDFDFAQSWADNYAKGEAEGSFFADEKELFFVNKLKAELAEDVEIIKRQKAAGFLDKQRCEKRFLIPLSEQLAFKGFVDKIMYHKNAGEQVIAVVDYKTGSASKIRRKLMPFGLSLQLPAYLYLLSKDEEFNRAYFGGFYLQHLINNDYKYDEEKSRAEIKQDSLKLDGYSSANVERLLLIDNDLKNIRGIKLKKDGSLAKTSNILADAEMNELINLVEEKIIEAGNNILRGNFAINPKQIDGENLSCTYCPYRDICYKQNSNLVFIKTKEAKDETD